MCRRWAILLLLLYQGFLVVAQSSSADIAITKTNFSIDSNYNVYGLMQHNQFEFISGQVQITNLGPDTARNIKLAFNVNTSINQLSDTSAVGNLAPGDTIWHNLKNYKPTLPGIHYFNLRINHDSLDQLITNNYDSTSFQFSEVNGLYRSDHDTISGFLGTNSFNGSQDGSMMLNLFEFDEPYEFETLWLKVGELITK